MDNLFIGPWYNLLSSPIFLPGRGGCDTRHKVIQFWDLFPVFVTKKGTYILHPQVKLRSWFTSKKIIGIKNTFIKRPRHELQLLKLFQPKRPYVSLKKRTISDNFGSKDFNLLIYNFFFHENFCSLSFKDLKFKRNISFLSISPDSKGRSRNFSKYSS